jgi:hypothetical protein
MDQLDRGLRQRLLEETVRHRLADEERGRGTRAQMWPGQAEPESAGRRLLLAAALVGVVLVVVIMLAVAAGQRAEQTTELDAGALRTPVGGPTLEVVRVQPPDWLRAEILASGGDRP